MNTNGTGESQGQNQDSVNETLMQGWGGGDANPSQEQGTQQAAPNQQTTTQQGSQSGRTVQTQQGQQAQPVQAVTPQTGLSEADLTRIATVAAGASRQAIQQAQPPAQAQTMTDQEFAARYKTPQVSEQTMQAIMDADPKKGAAELNKLLRQTYTSALLMANDLHKAELGGLRNEFTPHITAFQTYKQQVDNQAAEGRFFQSNQDLAQERDLVMEVKDAFLAKVQRGEISFTSEAEAFKAVADNVRKIVNRMGAQSTNGAGQQSQQVQGQPQQRRMATMTSQGRGGTGQSQSGGSPLDKAMDSWQ